MIRCNGVYTQHPINESPSEFSWDLDDLPALGRLIRTEPCGKVTMHSACFIGFLLLTSNLATVDEILGDYGLVHELAHIQEFGPSVTPKAASVEELADFADNLIARLHTE